MAENLTPDDRRCQFTNSRGQRCRSVRLDGDYTLCYAHFSRAERWKPEPDPGLVAEEILSPAQTLDSAGAVNSALTRVFRLVGQGRLSTRHATTLCYAAQLILCGLPQMQREAAAVQAHPLALDLDALIAELAQTLRRSIEKRSNGDSADSGANSKTAEAGS
jgi:hypothetical protein